MKRFYTILAALAAAACTLTACGGGGGGGTSSQPPTAPIPPVAQTPAPPPPTTSQTVTCPSSGPSASSVATLGAAQSELRRGPNVDMGANRYVPGLITVVYASGDAARNIDSTAAQIGARPVSNEGFAALGVRARVLSLNAARTTEAIARLRRTPGVVSVEQAQYRHIMSTVSANDPYYRGFGPGGPYYESSTLPGQWDMHVMNVGTAWGYYSSVPAAGAPIAVIDTGVDVTHPDLKGGKIVRQHCYVTYPSSSTQSSGSYAVDADGHGTNVAGIADADTNNAFGFAGVAASAPLLAYRIFPTTPSGGCEGSTSPQCSTTDVDEVSAINDAVAHGARVINLSLGAAGPLSSCQDSIEENAIESAIAHGVVVVAAAGNESKSSLDCPAAYPGVIAVGASGLSGSGSSLTEVVASYSNWSSTGTQAGSGAYLVAPGGTASGSSDDDDLHWIENITSSQMSGALAYCKPDFTGASGDCRGGFTGTSQATPHVTGVVSLMLGLRPHLTPAQIASDLCATAHKIGDSKEGCGRVDAAAAVAKALTQ